MEHRFAKRLQQECIGGRSRKGNEGTTQGKIFQGSKEKG